MLQFNLLPDVKLQYVKAQRTKYLLTFISVVAGAAGLVILLFSLFTVYVVQKKSLSDLNKDIANYSTQLKNVKDLDKILTVQNQLSTLTSLHDQKPVVSRLFSYITQLTPSRASLTKLTVDYEAKTISIGGSADSLDVVSKYTDILKGTKYKVDGSSAASPAFSSVVLSTFTRDDKSATFTITAGFDPAIFDTKQNVSLVVPQTSSAGQSTIFGGVN